MSPRLGQIPLESASQSEYPVSDACVGWSSLGFRLSKKFLGSFSTCADVATHQTPETPTIECGKSLTGGRSAPNARSLNSFECSLGLTGRPTFWPQDGLRIGRLKSEAASTLGDSGLDFLRRLKRREQRLRLGDLRHFGRRRETFEGGREDGLGFGQAVGRLVELGQRERREQFVTACALLFRDGDGRSIGVLCGRGIGGVSPRKDVTPNAMQKGIGPSFTRFAGQSQSLIDRRDRGADISLVHLAFREQSKEQWTENVAPSADKIGDRLAQFRSVRVQGRKSTPRPNKDDFAHSGISPIPCSRATWSKPSAEWSVAAGSLRQISRMALNV